MTPLEEWTRCEPWIAKALERTGFYNIEDVRAEIEAGNMIFWPGKNAAAITEFITYPNGKALNVFAGGGESNASLSEFMDIFEPSLATFAKANDCRWILGHGRPGWEKPCGKAGYQAIWTVMSKEL